MFCSALIGGGMPAPLRAEQALPAIGIIIDDMGYRMAECREALSLPGPLAYSFFPHLSGNQELLQRAMAGGKEILLHLPMEAEHKNNLLGPGALFERMSQGELEATLNSDFASVPQAVGVNNHEGSVLTADPQAMGWLMQAIKTHGGLFFVDSRTTGRTVAGQTAAVEGVPHLNRDVFLDNESDRMAIRRQFLSLIETAKHRGTALAIGHPKPETLAVLAEMLPTLPQYGVQLVALHDLLARQSLPEVTWQSSSSHSPRVAKN
ncbi:MAG TPA: divergent polysaccharide deacetylase family protein [Gammaproteobacteria bacterium]|nr:divergent polysaccharide deacetylase family protein [Gammaproteobacteria bacterium]